MQALCDAYGNLLWLSPALPGATHDMNAVRVHGLDTALDGKTVLADLGYVGSGWVLATKKPRYRELSEVEKDCNVAHARVRSAVERVFAKLKSWKCLVRFRPSPERADSFVAAVGTLLRVGMGIY